jgi:ATP-binding cassette subfamily F protein 3
MNAICGKEPVKVTGGKVSTLTNIRVSYVPQRAGEKLMHDHPDVSPAVLFTNENLFSNEKDARQHMGKFGISGGLGTTPIKLLSGGQRTRLAIAISCAKSTPHVLILDEPSHGLDVQAKHALAEALRGFPGALLVSSHDRDFIRFGGFNELWITSKGTLKCEIARKEEEEEEQQEAFWEIFDAYLDTL